MPLGLGLASSHAPSMFAAPEDWPKIYATLTQGVPQPPQAAAETPEVVRDYVARIRRNLRALREQIEAYRPDAIVIVGDDQYEIFSAPLIPQLALYLGETAAGTTNISLIGQPQDTNHMMLRCQTDLARHLLGALVARDFDVSYVEKLTPMGRRPPAGMGHAFMHLGHGLGLDELGVPVVIFWVNCYSPPCPSAARCWALGGALREILAAWPGRVAMLASGGMSHDPRGPRAGWIDEPLDHWVLDALAAGEGERLQSLFTFDSETMRSGTGELRNWITVAGAFSGVPATVVDYLPAHHAVTGLGWAYWRAE